MPDTKPTYQDLEKELNTLKAELEAQKEATRKARKRKLRFAARVTNIFLGSQLTTELKNIKNKVGNLEKPTADDWIDLSGAIFYRITRIGVITIFLGLLPTMMLVIQSVQLRNQNTLFKAQNERISQQTYLQEADRRSSLVFLFSNVMDAIDRELTTDYGNDGIRNLSPQLVGRIISLSQRLKPYQYLDGDTLISQPLSPERGQLLINLLESKLDTNVYAQIYEKADFSYADLKNSFFDKSYYLRDIALNHADLSGTYFDSVTLNSAVMISANLNRVTFHDVTANGIILMDASMNDVSFRDCNFPYSDFRNADLRNTNYQNSMIVDEWITQVNFTNSRFEDAKLDNVEFSFCTFEQTDIACECVSVSSTKFIDCFLNQEDALKLVSKGAIIPKEEPIDIEKIMNEGINEMNKLIQEIEKRANQ